MSFINDSKLMESLGQLHKTWTKEAGSFDIEQGKRDWIRGVVYGIGLAMKHVKAYLDERKRLEG